MVNRCLLHSYQLHVSALMAIFRLMNQQKTHKQLHLACVFYTEEWWAGLLDGGTRSCVFGMEGGVYGCVLC